MITIEEGAYNYAKRMKESRMHGQRVSVVLHYEDFHIEGFIAGAEFAQRWISIDEDLPEQSDKKYQVLVKSEDIKNINYGLILTKWIIDSSDVDYIKRAYTHWRPIELK